MKITIEGAIYFDLDSLRYTDWDKFKFFGRECKDFGSYIAVLPHTLEVEIPDNFDYRPSAVKLLETQRQELRDKFAAAVMEIDQRINSLLAIENHGG